MVGPSTGHLREDPLILCEKAGSGEPRGKTETTRRQTEKRTERKSREQREAERRTEGESGGSEEQHKDDRTEPPEREIPTSSEPVGLRIKHQKKAPA